MGEPERRGCLPCRHNTTMEPEMHALCPALRPLAVACVQRLGSMLGAISQCNLAQRAGCGWRSDRTLGTIRPVPAR